MTLDYSLYLAFFVYPQLKKDGFYKIPAYHYWIYFPNGGLMLSNTKPGFPGAVEKLNSRDATNWFHWLCLGLWRSSFYATTSGRKFWGLLVQTITQHRTTRQLRWWQFLWNFFCLKIIVWLRIANKGRKASQCLRYIIYRIFSNLSKWLFGALTEVVFKFGLTGRGWMICCIWYTVYHIKYL